MDIYINAAAMTPILSHGHNETDMLTAVFKELLKQYNIDPKSLQAVIVSNSYGAISMRQAAIRPQSWLKNLDLAPIPLYSIESACAGGSVGVDLGVQMLEPGGNIMILGVEFTSNLSMELRLRGIAQGVPEDERLGLEQKYGQLAVGSLFMGFNESWTQYLLKKELATINQIASATVKSRFHASLNPLAIHRKPTTIEEVLNARRISANLTLPMCSSFADGAAGVIISTEKLHSSVRIKACKSYSGNGSMEYHERLNSCVTNTLSKVGLDIHDFDCIELHDATSAEEVYSIESLGIFEKGSAGEHIMKGDTTLGGIGPTVNPSGGLVSRGHPIGATGLCQIYELYLQLIDQADRRQTKNPKIALALNAGGMVSMDAASVVITALERI